jgi:hypothetical protein
MGAHEQAVRERRHQQELSRARRKQAYLYAGALMFLLTFSVKELLRDHWKEKADALEIAENTFLVRTDALHTSDRQITNLYVQRHAPKGRELTQQQLTSQTEVVLTNAYAASMQDLAFTDALSKLASNLSLSSEDKNTLAGLEQRSDDRGVAFHRVNEAYFRDPDKATPAIYDDAIELIRDAGLFETDAFTFSKTLIDAADRSRAWRTYFYEWASWLSIVLYLASWLVAFRGKNYDADIELAE